MRSGPTGTGTEYIEPGAERQLCAAILNRALEDWQNVSAGTPTEICQAVAVELGYPGPREELIAFFESDWPDWLCLACDVPVESYLEALGRGAR